MRVDFAPSDRSSIGIEWELWLVDRTSGATAPVAEAVLERCGDAPGRPIRGEYLTTMIELVSGVHRTVGGAVDDLRGSLAQVRSAAADLGVGLLGAGTHPLARALDQPLVSNPRYDAVADLNGYWAHQVTICGIHVHVGIDTPQKVMPIINGLCTVYPYLLAVSCSSPYWEGLDTKYASQRTMLYQQLATNGLPYPLATWHEFEQFVADLTDTHLITDASEIRWDIRPSPRFGTVESRIADSVPTFAEIAGIAALTQCFVEHLARTYEQDRPIEVLPPWLVRENKWRAARYGMDAGVIVPGTTLHEVPLREGLLGWLDRLTPVAADLDCRGELESIATVVEHGVSSERQRRAGGPRQALAQLLAETGAEAPGHDH